MADIDTLIVRANSIGSAILKWFAIFSILGGLISAIWKYLNPQFGEIGVTPKALFHSLVVITFLFSVLGMCATTSHTLISLYFAHKGKWARNSIYFAIFLIIAFFTTYELAYRIGLRDF